MHLHLFYSHSEPLEKNEVVLVTIKMDSNGVLSIKPDYNKGRKPYKADQGMLGRGSHIYLMNNYSFN